MSIATATACVTLARAKHYLQIPSATTTYDDTLGDMIDAITATVEKHIGYHIRSANYTEYYDGDGTQELWLREKLNTCVSGNVYVYVDSTRGFAADTRIPVAYVVLYPEESRIVLESYVFTAGNRNVKVYYPGGWSTAPEDIQLVALDMISREWKKSQQNLSGVTSMSKADQNFSYDFALFTDDNKARLAKYVRYYHG